MQSLLDNLLATTRSAANKGARNIDFECDWLGKNGLLPSKVGSIDQFDALLAMRNALAHGALEVHTPEMSLTVLWGCAEVINRLYAKPGD